MSYSEDNYSKFLDFTDIRQLERGYTEEGANYWGETETMWDRYRGMMQQQEGLQVLIMMRHRFKEEDPESFTDAILVHTTLTHKKALAHHRKTLLDQILNFYCVCGQAPPPLIEIAEQCMIVQQGRSGE